MANPLDAYRWNRKRHRHRKAERVVRRVPQGRASAFTR